MNVNRFYTKKTYEDLTTVENSFTGPRTSTPKARSKESQSLFNLELTDSYDDWEDATESRLIEPEVRATARSIGMSSPVKQRAPLADLTNREQRSSSTRALCNRVTRPPARIGHPDDSELHLELSETFEDESGPRSKLIESTLGDMLEAMKDMQGDIAELKKRDQVRSQGMEHLAGDGPARCRNMRTPGVTRRVSNMVKKLESSSERRFMGDESMLSDHNAEVLEFLRDQVRGKGVDEETATAAVKRRYQRVRNLHLNSHPGKQATVWKNAKLRRRQSRRVRLHARRTKVVMTDERELWRSVTVDMMSDEESENEDHLVIRTPRWRSKQLDRLVKVLDCRIEQRKAPTLMTRVNGPPSTRKPPTDANVEHLVDPQFRD